MSKMVSFRFPEGLLERVDSARGEEPRSKFVLRLLVGALEDEEFDRPLREAVARKFPPRSIPCEEVKQMGKGAQVGDYAERIKKVGAAKPKIQMYPEPDHDVSVDPPLRCPVCDFSAPSPNARCPKHGRRVR